MSKQIFFLSLILIILLLSGCNRNVAKDSKEGASEPKIEQKVFAICKDKILNREELIQVDTINVAQAELEQKCIDKCTELYNLSGLQYNPLQNFGSEEFSCLCRGSSGPCR